MSDIKIVIKPTIIDKKEYILYLVIHDGDYIPLYYAYNMDDVKQFCEKLVNLSVYMEEEKLGDGSGWIEKFVK